MLFCNRECKLGTQETFLAIKSCRETLLFPVLDCLLSVKTWKQNLARDRSSPTLCAVIFSSFHMFITGAPHPLER